MEKIDINNLNQKVVDALINNFCETVGVYECIAWLLGFGFTKEELLALKFNNDDIDYVKEEYI